jgi:hypothetical protein
VGDGVLNSLGSGFYAERGFGRGGLVKRIGCSENGGENR